MLSCVMLPYRMMSSVRIWFIVAKLRVVLILLQNLWLSMSHASGPHSSLYEFSIDTTIVLVLETGMNRNWYFMELPMTFIGLMGCAVVALQELIWNDIPIKSKWFQLHFVILLILWHLLRASWGLHQNGLPLYQLVAWETQGVSSSSLIGFFQLGIFIGSDSLRFSCNQLVERQSILM